MLSSMWPFGSNTGTPRLVKRKPPPPCPAGRTEMPPCSPSTTFFSRGWQCDVRAWSPHFDTDPATAHLVRDGGGGAGAKGNCRDEIAFDRRGFEMKCSNDSGFGCSHHPSKPNRDSLRNLRGADAVIIPTESCGSSLRFPPSGHLRLGGQNFFSLDDVCFAKRQVSSVAFCPYRHSPSMVISVALTPFYDGEVPATAILAGLFAEICRGMTPFSMNLKIIGRVLKLSGLPREFPAL